MIRMADALTGGERLVSVQHHEGQRLEKLRLKMANQEPGFIVCFQQPWQHGELFFVDAEIKRGCVCALSKAIN